MGGGGTWKIRNCGVGDRIRESRDTQPNKHEFSDIKYHDYSSPHPTKPHYYISHPNSITTIILQQYFIFDIFQFPSGINAQIQSEVGNGQSNRFPLK